jgi:hypothetical protein
MRWTDGRTPTVGSAAMIPAKIWKLFNHLYLTTTLSHSEKHVVPAHLVRQGKKKNSQELRRVNQELIMFNI